MTPRAVLRAALDANIIADGETWMAALDARNRMSHTYNQQAFARIVDDIQHRYAGLLSALHDRLAAERRDD